MTHGAGIDDATAEALRSLSYRYASAADNKEFEAMAALFGSSGRLVTPRGTRTGEAEIAEALAGLGRYDRTFHLVGQVRVFVGDHGEPAGETYCTARHFTQPDADGPITDVVMHIRYHDQFVADPSGPNRWTFGERRLDVVATGTQQLQP